MEIKTLLENLALDDLLRLSYEIQKTIEDKTLLINKNNDSGENIININELDISVRCYHAFSSHGLIYLHEIAKWTKEDCLEFKNIGKKSIEEMTIELEKHGLNWKK